MSYTTHAPSHTDASCVPAARPASSHDDGYVAKGSEVARRPGQVFGVPGEDKILRALAAKSNAGRRIGHRLDQPRRQRHAHGHRDTW